MDIKLKNTATGKKEIFKPIQPGQVGMYNCGPTVYNYAHIGNLRAYVFADTLRRVMEYNGYEVKQVINITDIGHLVGDGDEGEDKMTKALKRENKPITMEAMKKLAQFYADKFKADLEALNIKHALAMPFASEHVAEDIAIIAELEKKGFAYKTSDGIYFDTEKDPHYGKLGGINKADEGVARIANNSEKKNPRDFALWKFNAETGFPSPWGQGFPGWHIECSGMSRKYLGETFDIHTGGIEHISVHHNNEIAQSETSSGKPLANYWLHGEWLTVDNEKISKSLGNDVYLKTILERGIDPLAYRYFLLQAHYASRINFSWDALEAAQTALRRLRNNFQNLGEKIGNVNEEYKTKFLSLINDNLDTPQALALVWELIKDTEISQEDKKATLLDFDKVLGIKIDQVEEIQIPEEVQKLIDERSEARKNKDWERADELRERIQEMGFEVKDK